MKCWMKISGGAESKQWHSHAIQTIREISCNKKNYLKNLRLKINSCVHLYCWVSSYLVALYKVSTSAWQYSHCTKISRMCIQTSRSKIYCDPAMSLPMLICSVLRSALWSISFPCQTTAEELVLANANCYSWILFRSYHIQPLWMLNSWNSCENSFHIWDSTKPPL